VTFAATQGEAAMQIKKSARQKPPKNLLILFTLLISLKTPVDFASWGYFHPNRKMKAIYIPDRP